MNQYVSSFHFISYCYVAGTGKSAIIKVASLHAERILRKAGDKPNHPRVLLTAHTGRAASLIGKLTYVLSIG